MGCRKEALREKFIVIYAYLRKPEKSHKKQPNIIPKERRTNKAKN